MPAEDPHDADYKKLFLARERIFLEQDQLIIELEKRVAETQRNLNKALGTLKVLRLENVALKRRKPKPPRQAAYCPDCQCITCHRKRTNAKYRKKA